MAEVAKHGDDNIREAGKGQETYARSLGERRRSDLHERLGKLSAVFQAEIQQAVSSPGRKKGNPIRGPLHWCCRYREHKERIYNADIFAGDQLYQVLKAVIQLGSKFSGSPSNILSFDFFVLESPLTSFVVNLFSFFCVICQQASPLLHFFQVRQNNPSPAVR